MIDRKFWEDARKVWVIMPPPKIKDVKTGSGGEIDPSLLIDLWSIGTRFSSNGQVGRTTEQATKGERDANSPKAPESFGKPKLNKEKFDELMEKQDMPGYIGASQALLECDLPDKMVNVYGDLIEQMRILAESVDKFKDVYHTNLDQFYEYYIPEALQLTATYLEYIEMGIDDGIVHETEIEVMQALDKLLLSVKEKKDEIYKFASIEIKAKAKALESLMSQDGFVNPEYKIK